MYVRIGEPRAANLLAYCKCIKAQVVYRADRFMTVREFRWHRRCFQLCYVGGATVFAQSASGTLVMGTCGSCFVSLQIVRAQTLFEHNGVSIVFLGKSQM
jgi:hypothetical protein